MYSKEKAKAYDDLIVSLWRGAIHDLQFAEEECNNGNRGRLLSCLLGEADGKLEILRSHYDDNEWIENHSALSEMLGYFYEDGLMLEIYEISESTKKYTLNEIRDVIRRAITSVKTMAVLAGVNDEK